MIPGLRRPGPSSSFAAPGRGGRGFLLLVALLAGVSGVSGCAKQLTRTLVDPSRASTLDRKSPFLKVHMRDGSVFVLKEWEVNSSAKTCAGSGRHFDAARVDLGSGTFAVPLDSVAVFETNVSRPSPSIAALAVLSAASLALTAYCISEPKACFGSCPTFYVTDGVEPVLQAEGFSSSVAPSLERTDVDALYRARPSGSLLEVRMTNEALETHVVRSVNVLAVPRPPGGRVFATSDGKFYPGTALVPPRRALAPEGDCASALAEFDGIERASPADSFDLAAREVIDLEFPAVPEGPRGLVIASRQTLLTTYLYYQGLAYMGSRAGEWLAALERGDVTTRERSEGIGRALGEIEVLCPDDNGDWRRVGSDRETGPIATDVRMVPLPGSDRGPVRVRLRMARGAWRLDLVALAAVGGPVEPLRIAPSGVHRGETDAPDALAALLDPGQVLTTFPGDAYDLTYPLPGDPDRYEFFLESRGYYLEWMREEWLTEENPGRAAMMLLEPERALRVLAPEWKAQEPTMEAAFWGSRYARP